MSVDQPAPGPPHPGLLSAHDIAARHRRSPGWAWARLRRWRAAGWVTATGTPDAITGARRYPAEQVEAAYHRDQQTNHAPPPGPAAAG